MKEEEKNDLKREYKGRTHLKGIFRVTCKVTEESWVDSSTDFSSSENRFRFGLKMSSLQNPSLRESAKMHPAETFSFEILETFDDDLSPYELGKQLKERRKFWMGKLDARGVFRS